MVDAMKEIIGKFISFEKELDNNKMVVKEKFACIHHPVEHSLLKVQRELNRIEPTVLDFYEIANGIEVKWHPTNPALLERDIVGRIKVNSFSQTVRDWSGVVFFEHHPADSPQRKFFPMDFFADEAAAGFCTKEGWRKMIYLYKFEGDLIPLHVTLESYLSLMLQAKGCYYWQYLILEMLQQEENEMSVRIKQYLPSLFPDFSFAMFEKSFNETRIKQ